MRGVTHLKIAGLGVLASLAVAPAAHAALAGAIPLRTETRPDLVSVNIRNDDTTSPKRVTYCFDEAIQAPAGGFDANDFELYGYDADSFVDGAGGLEAPQVEGTNNKCVAVRFPNNTDLKHYTVGGVDEGAVRNQHGLASKVNLDDATALDGSIEQVGNGLTDAPDIIQVALDPTYNQIVYTFDRPIEPGSWNFGPGGFQDRFFFYDAAGNRYFPNAISQDSDSRNTLRLQFNGPFGGSVLDAVRIGIETGATCAENDTNECSVRQTVAAPNQDGNTARPELLSAVIAANGDSNAVDYTFDQPVQINDISGFELYNASEAQFLGDHAQVLVSKPNTVRVWFDAPVGSINGEMVVASVDDFFGPGDAAVIGTNGGLRNGVQSLPLGNLRGVKGFTSAADATGVTFNQDEGSATVTFDQDLSQVFGNDFDLVDRFGNVYVFQPQDVALVSGNHVKLLLPAGTAQNAVGVVIHDSATQASNGEFSVQQAVGRANAPVSPGPGPLVPAAPATAPAGANPPAVAASNTGAVAPATVAVSPAKTAFAKTRAGRIVSARVVRTKNGKAVIVLKVSSKAKTAKVRIRVTTKSGKVVRTIVKTVKTNRTVRISGVKASKAQKLRLSLA